MKMTSVAVLTIYLTATQSFHLSLNTFKWQQAEDYCIEKCNSHLASIHSDTEYREIINLIKSATNDIMTNIADSTNTFIGLNQLKGPGQWEWTDGTPFDFASDTSGGVYPWSRDDPELNECIIIEGTDHDGDYLWNDKYCNQTNNIFICNSCDRVLTKYAIIDEIMDHNSATTACQSMYGTELLSIHSDNDLSEAVLLCNLTNQQLTTNLTLSHDCFIGLYSDPSTLIYSWDDGTTFDYNTDFAVPPWDHIPDQINKDCTDLDASDGYLLSDAACWSDRYSLCNIPSEICYSNQWLQIKGTGWSFKTTPCQIINGYVSNDNNIAMITQKRWDNNGQSLLLEYTYTMKEVFGQFIGESTAGIIWYIDTISSCSNYYYIGISYIGSTVFLAHVKNENIEIIHSVSLGFTYLTGTFYILQAIISNTNTFTISVNGNTLLSNIAGSNEFHSINTNIGYIGIKNTKSSIIAKSLFISGKTTQDIADDAITWFDDCPTTNNPTYDPTPSPTNNPTPSPTSNPTTNPTPSSTSNSTTNPTPSPTDAPSAFGSSTKNPTDTAVSPTNNPILATSSIITKTSTVSTATTVSPTPYPTSSRTQIAIDNLTSLPTTPSFVDSATYSPVIVTKYVNLSHAVNIYIYIIIISISCIICMVCCGCFILYQRNKLKTENRKLKTQTGQHIMNDDGLNIDEIEMEGDVCEGTNHSDSDTEIRLNGINLQALNAALSPLPQPVECVNCNDINNKVTYGMDESSDSNNDDGFTSPGHDHNGGEKHVE